jgi:hypothetical protein
VHDLGIGFPQYSAPGFLAPGPEGKSQLDNVGAYQEVEGWIHSCIAPGGKRIMALSKTITKFRVEYALLNKKANPSAPELCSRVDTAV